MYDSFERKWRYWYFQCVCMRIDCSLDILVPYCLQAQVPVLSQDVDADEGGSLRVSSDAEGGTS